MQELNFQGKTDPLILYESLESIGLTENEIDRRLPELKNAYFRLLEKNLQEFPVKLMPGIIPLLKALSPRDDIITGLLTGNFSTSAYMKVGVHGLEGFFPFGVFGDDTAVRNEMPAIGQAKIKNLYNHDIDFSDIFIIGDTEHDIACAKHAGAVSVAVGTGWTDRGFLRSQDPDYYFDDLGDTREVMKIFS